VEKTFGDDIDYAQLQKIYGKPHAEVESHRRYSPTPCLGAKKEALIGAPDMKHVSTSYVERQNLNIRMGLRRFTRLTNAFSKKMENHCHALSIYFMHYNFARIHQTTRVTPAMACGVTEKLWDMTDIVRMIEAYEGGEPMRTETERKFGGKLSVGPISKTAHTYES
jgi:hypothetical protein